MATKIKDIKALPVKRLPTGLSSIDRLYGKTRWTDPQGNKKMLWGLPDKAISLWAGQGGIGKSRLAVEVTKAVTKKRYKVLYFQNEMPESRFADKILAAGGLSDYLYLSESKVLAEQIKEIKEVKPHLIVIDSINMVEDFGYGSDRKVKNVITAYEDVLMEQGGHVIFLSQLTKKGEARGSTVLSHLVDVVFKLKTAGPGMFWFDVGNKNRYGEVGPIFSSTWDHHDTGVVEWSQGFEFEDQDWCESNGLQYESFEMGVERRRNEIVAGNVSLDRKQVNVEIKRDCVCLLVLFGMWTVKVVAWCIIGLVGAAAGGMYAMSHSKK